MKLDRWSKSSVFLGFAFAAGGISSSLIAKASTEESASVSMSEAPDAAPTVALKDFNLVVSPLGYLLGEINGAFQFALSDRFAMGPRVAFQSYELGNNSSSSSSASRNSSAGVSSSSVTYGVIADLYLSGPRFTSSWVLSPFFSATNYSGSVGIGPLGNASTGFSYTTLGADIGYNWVMKSGFNFALGLGAQRLVFEETTKRESLPFTLRTWLPSFRLTLGYAF
jgi:hypothetical protein